MKQIISYREAIAMLISFAIGCSSDLSLESAPASQRGLRAEAPGNTPGASSASVDALSKVSWFVARPRYRRTYSPPSSPALSPTMAANAAGSATVLSSTTADAGMVGSAGAGAVVLPASTSPAPASLTAPAVPLDAGSSAASASASADAGAIQPASSGAATTAPAVNAASFPGGFIEKTTSTDIRPRLSQAELQALLPAAGHTFVFPAPYGTQALRLTDANSCGGQGDCVRYVGYAYWRNMNNHVGQDTMLIFLGLNADLGGAGLSLFRYHKDTDALESLGPIFTGTGIEPNVTGEGIYFSGTKPTVIYVAQASKLLRFDVIAKTTEVVFDAAPSYGTNTYLWQHHSSDDDRVHSSTLRANDTGAVLGCLVYWEDTATFKLYPPIGDFDECQVDRGGNWLIIKDNIDGKNGEDNRLIDLHSLAETDLLDENGAAGHSDFGYGVLVAEDNWNSLPGAVRAWGMGQNPLVGDVVYHEPAWRSDGSSHITHTNARPGIAREREVVCQSTVARGAFTRGSEIFCYRLDGLLDVMVVAPVMTDLDAAGGGDDYSKAPKGNLDVTGRYFIWTSNAGGDRLDAFLVKVPTLLE